MTRTFKAPTQAEAHAKADAWLKSQPAMKSITRQAYVFRAAFPKQGLDEDEGSWTVAVHYQLDWPGDMIGRSVPEPDSLGG